MSEFSFLKQDNIAQTFVESFPPSNNLKSNKRKEKATKSSGSKKLKEEKEELKTELNEIKKGINYVKESVEQLTFNHLKDSDKLKIIQQFLEKKIKQEQINLRSSGQYVKVEEKYKPKEEKPSIIKKEVDDDIEILGEERVEYKCGACDMRAISERQIKLHWDQGCQAIKTL